MDAESIRFTVSGFLVMRGSGVRARLTSSKIGKAVVDPSSRAN